MYLPVVSASTPGAWCLGDTHMYHWFSSFAVVMLCNAATNTEWPDTELLLLEKHRVQFLQASGHIFVS